MRCSFALSNTAASCETRGTGGNSSGFPTVTVVSVKMRVLCRVLARADAYINATAVAAEGPEGRCKLPFVTKTIRGPQEEIMVATAVGHAARGAAIMNSNAP
jgi:hypothetical protein